jgi:hypothetical protein
MRIWRIPGCYTPARRRLGRCILVGVGLLLAVLADGRLVSAGGPLCTLFGQCYYAGLPFAIRVADAETGEPLADVHALAEWVQNGMNGRAGPVMVQDAVSGSDGLLHFPAWGPLRGSSGGLGLGEDPIITLFKPGYFLPRPFPGGARVISNQYPPGTEETTRTRRFGQDGQTFPMEPFRETTDEWAMKLVGIGGLAYGRAAAGEDGSRKFYRPYMNRMQRVRDALQAVPRGNPEIERYVRVFEREFHWLEGLRP